MKLKVGVEYITRDGKPARVNRIEGRSPVTYVGHVYVSPRVGWRLTSWCEDGRWWMNSENADDLVAIWDQRTKFPK